MDSRPESPGVVALRLAEAQGLLGEAPLSPGEVIAAAVQLLIEGSDSPSLRVLAGLEPTDAWSVDQYLGQTLAELHLAPLAISDAFLREATAIAARIVDGTADLRQAAPRLWDIFVMAQRADVDRALGPEFYSLASAGELVDEGFDPGEALVTDAARFLRWHTAKNETLT